MVFVVESLLKFLISPYICLAVEQTFVKLISVSLSLVEFSYSLYYFYMREMPIYGINLFQIKAHFYPPPPIV